MYDILFEAVSVYAYCLVWWVVQFCDATGRYRVRQIVHKTTRTDVNSRTLQAVEIV